MKKNERGILRKVLENSYAYKLFQKLIRPNVPAGSVMRRYIPQMGKGKRILDLGCGTAEILKFLHGEESYVGIDYNDNYIAGAAKEYQNRKTARFISADLNAYASTCTEKFDIVLMIGVLHHIDDQAIEMTMKSIRRILDPNGEFISLDCCYSKQMNPIARLIVSLDRGRHVRHEDEMTSLMNRYWKNVWYEKRTDTLKLPYNVIAFKCSGIKESFDDV